MKRLIINESASYSSETIMHNDMKFKISSDNGNAYCRIRVDIYTENGDLALVASFNDIPNAKYVQYYDSDDNRKHGNLYNLRMCEEYIKKVYPSK